MKYLLLVLILGGCGYTGRDSDMIGQVKKVAKMTPLICPDRTDVDLSLGVIRNGVGSMSSEDVWTTVHDPEILKTLKAANESGALVKVVYDVHRFTVCQEPREITKAEIVK